MKIFATLVLILGLGTIGQPLSGITFQDVKEFDKISLSLTGRPLKPEQRAAVLSGQLSRQELVEELTKSDRFVEHLARFWVDKIGVANRLSIAEMLLKGKNENFHRTLFGNQEFVGLFERNPNDNRDDAYLDEIIQRLNRKTRRQLSQKTCGDKQVIFHEAYTSDPLATVKKVVSTGKWPDASGGTALKGSQDKYKTILRIFEEFNPACDSDQLVAVKPFWAPQSDNWLTAKRLVDPEICGADLSKCWVRNEINNYQARVDEYFTMEPGYLIAQTVAEDKPFNEILTTSRTVVNELAAYYHKTHLPLNDAIANFPGGAYQEKNESRWVNPRYNLDGKRFWVERTPLHSGVLTSFAFQMVTNGRRAKANRVYEVFLCSRFTVPEGAQPDQFDDNPDLRKRAYCANCHRTLEPMASFFNKWPDTGRVTMEYYDDPKIKDEGMFQGDSGAGAKTFGKIASETDAFARCSIRRTFEFIHGRELSQAESSVLVPRYRSIYEQSGSSIRAVMKAMIDADEFTQPQGGE